MNGAESLVKTLVDCNVDVCFANPGTSEMHFVAALDQIKGMRCVLGLFEGIVTGAADGYFRLARKPACTLLHLGPGLANGVANLHNAKKANSGIINIVGQHALGHIALDAPLTSDIEGIAKPVSNFIIMPSEVSEVGRAAVSAVAAASGVPQQIATLILPADMAWSDGGLPDKNQKNSDYQSIDEQKITEAAALLSSGEKTLILLGGNALNEETISRAGRIARQTNCKLLTEWSNARLDRGAGRVELNRIPYVVEKAVAVLKQFEKIILVGAREPVAFFAYPNQPGRLSSPNCQFLTVSDSSQNADSALEMLEERVGAKKLRPVNINTISKPQIPNGNISLDGIACVLGAFLPEGAIVVDESVTTGREFFPRTACAEPHVWLNNRGGSIGFGLPVALGASIACPNRKVIALQSDGSGMYTPQAIWSIAREKLDITILIFSNRSYNILYGELKNVGVNQPGPHADKMFSLRNPDINWVSLASGMGVEATKVDDMKSFSSAFKFAMDQQHPHLIEIEI